MMEKNKECHKNGRNKRSFPSTPAIFPLLFALALMLFAACGKDRHIPEVSHIPVDLELVRFERQMYDWTDSTEIEDRARGLARQYPGFTEIYASPNVMRGPAWADSSDAAVLAHLMRGPQMKMLYDTCMAQFADFSPYEAEMQEAFRYFKYYFPDRPLPRLYTCITEFGYQGFTYGPEILAISVDHFMGKDFPAYPTFFPRYQSRAFTPEHLVPTSMGLYVAELLIDHPSNTLLDEMLREGKKLYILDHLLPYTPDSLKLAYTAEQTQWCEDNELEMWAFFRGEELLFSTDKREYLKYVSPAPTSPGMPRESPGRTANWVGWQIVKSYMERFPGTSFEELVALRDSQKFLKKARYRP